MLPLKGKRDVRGTHGSLWQYASLKLDEDDLETLEGAIPPSVPVDGFYDFVLAMLVEARMDRRGHITKWRCPACQDTYRSIASALLCFWDCAGRRPLMEYIEDEWILVPESLKP